MLAVSRRQVPPHTQPAVTSTDACLAARPDVRILVLNANRFAGEMLCSTLKTLFFGATLTLVSSLSDVDDRLTENAIDLLVTDIAAVDGNACDRIVPWAAANRGTRRTLIATRHTEPVVVHTLSHMPVAGVFDTSGDSLINFQAACATVVGGGSYWSASILGALAHAAESPTDVYRLLTPTEQMVLGVIGDGCDDATATESLPLKESTIRSTREAIHRKIGVQHKGQLMARAVEYGFVVRTEHGIVRPGLADLIAAYRPTKRGPESPRPARVA